MLFWKKIKLDDLETNWHKDNLSHNIQVCYTVPVVLITVHVPLN